MLAEMLDALGGNLGFLGHVGDGFEDVMGRQEGPKIGFPIFAPINKRYDVVALPCFACGYLPAAAALAMAVEAVEDAEVHAGRRGSVRGGAEPFGNRARHQGVLSQMAMKISVQTKAVASIPIITAGTQDGSSTLLTTSLMISGAIPR